MEMKAAEKTGERAGAARKMGQQSEISVKGEVATKGVRRISAVTAEELGAEMESYADVAEVPEEIRDQVYGLIDNYKAHLVERTENHLKRLAMVGPEIGDVTLPSGYVYWDLVALSPIQFIAPPFTFLPHKVIAAGELTLLLAVLFINPGAADGSPSATTVLGSRGFRVRFEHLDVTNVANGPDFAFVGIFPPIAPVLSLFPVFTIFPDPGPNPRILDLTVTADITNMGQPFAVLQTNHLDIDSDPAFLGVPAQSPQFRNQTPLRYLVYKKF